MQSKPLPTLSESTVSTVELTVESTIDSNVKVILRLTVKYDRYRVLQELSSVYTC